MLLVLLLFRGEIHFQSRLHQAPPSSVSPTPTANAVVGQVVERCGTVLLGQPSPRVLLSPSGYSSIQGVVSVDGCGGGFGLGLV